jgi:hypothetical protein
MQFMILFVNLVVSSKINITCPIGSLSMSSQI